MQQETSAKANVIFGHEHLDILSDEAKSLVTEKQIPVFLVHSSKNWLSTLDKCPVCHRRHHFLGNESKVYINRCFKKPPVGEYVYAHIVTSDNDNVVPVEQLHRTQLKTFIEDLNGQMIGVDFVKLDNKPRSLLGRLGVTAPLKGGKNTSEALSRPYLTVWDVQKRGYRNVNLSTVYRLRAAGKVFDILD